MRLENEEENVMKNLFTAVILGIAFAGVSLAHTSSEEKAGERQAAQAAKVKVAVVEFSPGPNAPGMTVEAKRHLQASLAFALFESDRFDVVDVRRTRAASAGDLAAINGGSFPAAVVKLGKQLGVSYVLTGTVVEYTPKGADGFGRVILKTRLIEVATGKVKHAGETTQQSTSAMRTNGAAEMQTKAMKPAIEKLTATLAGLRL
jgi:TolB-like protein